MTSSQGAVSARGDVVGVMRSMTSSLGARCAGAEDGGVSWMMIVSVGMSDMTIIFLLVIFVVCVCVKKMTILTEGAAHSPASASKSNAVTGAVTGVIASTGIFVPGGDNLLTWHHCKSVTRILTNEDGDKIVTILQTLTGVQ